jgi:Ca-activated chloride channel homolog
MTMLSKDAERDLSPLENPAISVSKLDLKAPGKARREYDKGVLLLARKDFKGAVEHLTAALSSYPNFVAAHNALGSSYLGLGQNEQAREEFAKAVALDELLPISHLNLGCAELALKNYPAAEAEVQRASAIAPLDLQLLIALDYAQLMNHNYTATIATANQVHARKHKSAAVVHYYAAAAWDNQSNLQEAQSELQKLLLEDPQSPAAEQARGILEDIQAGRNQPKTVKVEKVVTNASLSIASHAASDGKLSSEMQGLLQQSGQEQQIAEAEAMCPTCEKPATADAAPAIIRPASSAKAELINHTDTGYTMRKTVDEVAVLFAATDRGSSVPDLSRADVKIRDDRKAPAAVTGFLSQSQLPLRLGIVIDTSESITGRFAFEQKAATDFVQKVLTNKDDLAFVVGFANSVLLVQDFTANQEQLSHGIGQLAPAGGTALWDAVSFASDKLASRTETRPVARVLVVISDGEDNSSSTTLKEAIESAGRSEVIIYTVSTRDERDTATAFYQSYATNYFIGDRALKVLAEGSGGTPFFPGSLGRLNHSLDELQQVIRGRYLISYKPDGFEANGKYHSIDLTAKKSGRKLRVYVRKGYYARSDALAKAAY